MVTKHELDLLNGKNNVNTQICVPFPECRESTDAKRFLTHKLNRIINNSKSQIDRTNRNFEETYKFKERSIQNEIRKAQEDVWKWRKEQAFTHHMTKWLRHRKREDDDSAPTGSSDGSCSSPIHLPPLSNSQRSSSIKSTTSTITNMNSTRRAKTFPRKEQEHTKHITAKPKHDEITLLKDSNLNNILTLLDNPVSKKEDSLDSTEDIDGDLGISRASSVVTNTLQENENGQRNRSTGIIYEIKFQSNMDKRKKKKSTFLDRNYKKNDERLIHQYFDEQRQYKRRSAEGKSRPYRF